MDIQLLEDTFAKLDNSMQWMKRALSLMIILVCCALVVCGLFLFAIWGGSFDGPNREEVRAQHMQIIDSLSKDLGNSRTIISKLDSLNYGK